MRPIGFAGRGEADTSPPGTCPVDTVYAITVGTDGGSASSRRSEGAVSGRPGPGRPDIAPPRGPTAIGGGRAHDQPVTACGSGEFTEQPGPAAAGLTGDLHQQRRAADTGADHVLDAHRGVGRNVPSGAA